MQCGFESRISVKIHHQFINSGGSMRTILEIIGGCVGAVGWVIAFFHVGVIQFIQKWWRQLLGIVLGSLLAMTIFLVIVFFPSDIDNEVRRVLLGLSISVIIGIVALLFSNETFWKSNYNWITKTLGFISAILAIITLIISVGFTENLKPETKGFIVAFWGLLPPAYLFFQFTYMFYYARQHIQQESREPVIRTSLRNGTNTLSNCHSNSGPLS